MITSSSKPILKDPKFENKDYFILDEASQQVHQANRGRFYSQQVISERYLSDWEPKTPKIRPMKTPKHLPPIIENQSNQIIEIEGNKNNQVQILSNNSTNSFDDSFKQQDQNIKNTNNQFEISDKIFNLFKLNSTDEKSDKKINKLSEESFSCQNSRKLQVKRKLSQNLNECTIFNFLDIRKSISINN